MIRLSPKREPYWLDCGYGVRLRVNPLELWVQRAAEFESWSMAADAAKRDGVIAPDGRVADIEGVSASNKYVGLQQQFMLQALARHAVIEWEGIGAEDGDEAAPLTHENLDSLIAAHPIIARAFERQYLAQIEETLAEGEGSGSAPKTISTAEPTGAQTAESLDATVAHAPKNPTDLDLARAT